VPSRGMVRLTATRRSTFSCGHKNMRALLFAQVGLGSGIAALGALAIIFSLAFGACVFGSLGLISVFSRPPRAIEGVVVGGLGVASWCGQMAAALAFGLAWNGMTLLVCIACGAVAILPVVIGWRMVSSRSSRK
jgi:hypothetical protein